MGVGLGGLWNVGNLSLPGLNLIDGQAGEIREKAAKAVNELPSGESAGWLTESGKSGELHPFGTVRYCSI